MNASVHTLRELTAGICDNAAWPEIAVTGITLDSRKVAAGDLFLAVPGHVTDGRRFIDASLAAGAAAVLAESPAGKAADARVFEIAGLRGHLGTIADRFFDQPSHRLCVVGVTGTNGKTTCTHLMTQALAALGTDAAVMGTVGNGRPGALAPAALTTVDAIEVQRELKEFCDDGVEVVCMEVSSHALAQGRVDKVAFDYAVFTNLSQDHLDYHDDMASYGEAKARLFRDFDLAACVINVDDPFGRRLAGEIDPARLWTCGESSDARVRRESLEVAGERLVLGVRAGEVRVDFAVALAGRFNADNALAVFTALLAMGFEATAAARALEGVRAVPGRMESFHAPGRPRVVVDYAHTPDALAKALAACREGLDGELWVVFGCGGDRDRGKRAPMGAIAARLADHVVLTSDNPRGEPPMAIIDDIRAGGDGRETVLPERERAIAWALERAAAADVVLVAGKGHETGQTEAGVTRPFSDRELVRALLGGRG